MTQTACRAGERSLRVLVVVVDVADLAVGELHDLLEGNVEHHLEAVATPFRRFRTSDRSRRSSSSSASWARLRDVTSRMIDWRWPFGSQATLTSAQKEAPSVFAEERTARSASKVPAGI